MKKLIVLVVLAASLAIAFSSCASQHHCTAYSQAQTENPDANM